MLSVPSWRSRDEWGATAGSFLRLVGGVIAAKASIALLAIALKALGITVGGIMATLLPAILIVGVLGAVVAGFVVAFRRNVGGIADFAHVKHIDWAERLRAVAHA